MSCQKFKICAFFVLAAVFPCNGVSLLQQLEHIARRRLESRGESVEKVGFPLTRRSLFTYEPVDVTNVAGVPNHPSHLPEAEPVLPGHTLLRPTLGMLKSSIKFPHLEYEDGTGVYGNIENLGLRYNGQNERLWYSGFRRMSTDYDMENKNMINKLLEQLQQLNLAGKINVIILNTVDDSSDQLKHKILRYRPVKPISEMSDFNQKRHSHEPSLERVNEESDAQSEEERTPVDYTTIAEDINKQKLVQMLNAQKAYNHIKISESAPEYAVFMPAKVTNNLRDWWFYNQDNSKPEV